MMMMPGPPARGCRASPAQRRVTEAATETRRLGPESRRRVGVTVTSHEHVTVTVTMTRISDDFNFSVQLKVSLVG